MRTINVNGIEIQIKDLECSYNHNKCIPRKVEDQYVDLTIVQTADCNANCPFCCGPKDYIDFKLKPFKEFFSELIKQIRVRKVTFTGGEVTGKAHIQKTNQIISYIKSVSPSTWIVLNTNGFIKNPNRLNNSLIDQFAISRHHYDSKINETMFGYPKEKHICDIDLQNYVDLKKVNLTCVVQKFGISSGEELEKYFDWAIQHQIYDVSVISLIPINNYCTNNYIDPYTFTFSPKVYQYQVWDYPKFNVCTCSNFVYLNIKLSKTPLRFYMRKNLNCKYNKGSYIVWKNNHVDVY